MFARHVVTHRVIPALVIVLAVLAFTGCPGVFTISPGGTFGVDCYGFTGDMSKLQVVVVFDLDEQVGLGLDYVYAFPVGEYEDSNGDVQIVRSFECPDVPAGDYLVYAFLDYNGDEVYEPASSQDDFWVYGEPIYGIDTVPPTFLITALNFTPVPNYTVSSTYAAPLEFQFLYVGGPS